MDTKLRIGIIYGGRSGEHQVSLRSATAILQHLDTSRYDVLPIGIDQNGQWRVGVSPTDLPTLATDSQAAPDLPSITLLRSVDLLFPVLHGTFGEDGTLQGLLEMAGLAYVGCGVLASAVGMDKAIFKNVMQAHGLPILPYVLLTRQQIEHSPQAAIAQVHTQLDFPVFVKPANLGSSVGISKVTQLTDLLPALREAASWDRRVVVEQGINAREIELSVLGNSEPQVSIAGEVRPRRAFYDYAAKYITDDSELLIPAPLDPAELYELQDLARRAFLAIDGAGLARVDFLMDKDTGKIWLNEVNTLPGFTSISMYPKLWEASGLSFTALLEQLIQLALERQAERQQNKTVFEQPVG
jgi:D-alanine-D-alanine ligase